MPLMLNALHSKETNNDDKNEYRIMNTIILFLLSNFFINFQQRVFHKSQKYKKILKPPIFIPPLILGNRETL